MSGAVAAVVPAAGRGERLGSDDADGPKALRSLAGRPLLVRAVQALAAVPDVRLVVVAAPAGRVAEVRALLADCVSGAAVTVVAGGASRQESVAAGLAVLPTDVDVVLVHDAARPLVPAALVQRVLDAVRAGHDAVVPVLPLADTAKRVDPDGRVLDTVPRGDLRVVQTPQGFRRQLLVEAHAAAAGRAGPAPDDAALVEALGTPVWTVPGAEEAMKVTRPFDLLVAEATLRARDDR